MSVVQTHPETLEHLSDRLAASRQPDVGCMGLFPRWVRRGVHETRETPPAALGNTETLRPPELDGQIAPRGPLADGHDAEVADAPSDAPAECPDAASDAVRVARRTERLRRQHTAQRILSPSILADHDGWLRWRRVRACGRPFTPGSRDGDAPAMVEVRVYNADQETAGRAYYGRLEHCHNVWVCPECSLRIRTGRAAEVAEIVRRHCGEWRGAALLVTYTVSHHLGTPLKEVQDGLFAALRQLRGERAYKDFRRAQAGFVRAYEITYGPNGWHCHFHELWLCRAPGTPLWADIVAQHAREVLAPLWRHCLETHDMTCDDVHGLDVRAVSTDWADAAAKYVAKITEGFTGSELTGSDNKLAAEGHIVPYQLLDHPTKRNRALFREYAEATRGKRSITFSQGLRALYGLDTPESDAELDATLLAKQDSISHPIAELSAAAYRHVWARDRARLGQGLRAAEIGDWESFASMFPGCVVDASATRPDGTVIVRTIPEALDARAAARGPTEMDEAVRAADMRLAQLSRAHPCEAARSPLLEVRGLHHDLFGVYSRYADRVTCAETPDEVAAIVAEAEAANLSGSDYWPIDERERWEWMDAMRHAADADERAAIGRRPPVWRLGSVSASVCRNVYASLGLSPETARALGVWGYDAA